MAPNTRKTNIEFDNLIRDHIALKLDNKGSYNLEYDQQSLEKA